MDIGIGILLVVAFAAGFGWGLWANEAAKQYLYRKDKTGRFLMDIPATEEHMQLARVFLGAAIDRRRDGSAGDAQSR
ncbi:MAG: hypothetical protein EPN21_07985 [Methylococcaceae bacterium]|nr:MAG: hypothetical protein EPN21_07985 [Methylococcaceae bacterium]